ncbi:hypothetical protein QYE76_003935 [Lolium multiflorum]|uniref:Uncharacterized protein n=1 Tax=Lolium multiflorum TaxID=4521 RepID=A0AAD8RRA0_LOLMU|nr:hypothetical protein QYE76_003935 [Lolium multiflorum]
MDTLSQHPPVTSPSINRGHLRLHSPQQTCSPTSPRPPPPLLPADYPTESSNFITDPRHELPAVQLDHLKPRRRYRSTSRHRQRRLASAPAPREPPSRHRPLPRRSSTFLSTVDDDEAPPSDPLLIARFQLKDIEQNKSIKVSLEQDKLMEPYVQTETYDLENGGSLVFERDLYLVSERLERPPPKFHGVRIHNTPTGEQQWMITADLKGSSEPPISERILFSFKAYSWVDGLAHALQEGLARVCGQNIAALRGSRFAHFARHDTMGEPMALSSHPVLKIHVQHLVMLHETRKDLELTRVHSHRAQMALAHHADAIRLLAKDRRSLRLQRAKNVATITRLREKIRTLEVTVRTQQDQIQEMEEDGEDIQGGDDFLSDDNDFEDDEFTDEEDYEFLEAAEDGIIPIDVDEDNEE